MTPLVRETMSIIVAHSFSIHSRPFISFWICGMLMGASGRAAAWLSICRKAAVSARAEISEAAGLPIEPKRAASLDTEECVKPSDIMRKRGSEDCLDLDLHTRLAHTRAERAERRESQKRGRENAVAAPSAPSAPSAPPKASKAKRQRSEPGPPRTQDDDGWGWCSGARLAEDGDAGSLLRPRPEMSWGEHSLARALP